ncbi:MAG TPA: hypothetical protein VGH89_01035, partial [Pseudonocardia sp.]
AQLTGAQSFCRDDGTGRGKRLRSGELRALVEQTLTERVGSEFTVTQLSNMLRRSPGAIANAAEKLCDQGAAVRTSHRPKTYSGALESPSS